MVAVFLMIGVRPVRYIPLILLFGAFVPTASALTYSIDPDQSYVSYAVPFYENAGEIGWFTRDDGSVMSIYAWKVAFQEERHPLSGTLVTTPADYASGWLALSTDTQIADVPEGANFSLPARISYDPQRLAAGVYSPADTSFVSGAGGDICACFTSVDMTSEWWTLNGSLTDDVVRLDGTWFPSITMDPDSYFGYMSSEAPEPPAFDYVRSAYSYHLVAMVPELSTWMMWLSGLCLVARRARASHIHIRGTLVSFADTAGGSTFSALTAWRSGPPAEIASNG